MQTKRCEVCGAAFSPKPQVGDRQRTCGKSDCKRELHNRSHRKWLERNRGYYKGRYPYLKEWLRLHPGYLKKYREEKGKDLAHAKRCDIQDELTVSNNNKETNIFFLNDIQDELTSIVSENKRRFTHLAAMLYKMSYTLEKTIGYVR